METLDRERRTVRRQSVEVLVDRVRRHLQIVYSIQTPEDTTSLVQTEKLSGVVGLSGGLSDV